MVYEQRNRLGTLWRMAGGGTMRMHGGEGWWEVLRSQAPLGEWKWVQRVRGPDEVAPTWLWA